MTPSELVTACRNKYNAIGDSFWSDDEILGLLYEGSLEINREALLIERVYTAASVSDQQAYAFPSITISIKRVTFSGKKLARITMNEDDSVTAFNQATTETGTPNYYYQWNSTIYLRPVPNTDGDTIKIFAFNEPDVITTTSTLDIPTQFHRCLVDYAVGYMSSKDSNFLAAKFHLERWESHKNAAKRWVKKKDRGDGFNVVQDEESQGRWS